MARVFGIHEVNLRTGVSGADFERDVPRYLAAFSNAPGVRHAYLLKGDRGSRAGKYLFVLEMNSVEDRNRIFPASGETSKEAENWIKENADTWEKWGSAVETTFTDYVDIGSGE